MRNVAVWVLSVGGVIGLVMFFSVVWVERLNGFEFRMGFPDSWIVWESIPPGGHRSEINFVRWSVLILVASVSALQSAARLSRQTPAAVEPSSNADPIRQAGLGS